MFVSVTERGTYKRCRRRWDLGSENRQSLQAIGSGKPALELGSLVHKALAEWILNPDGNPEHFFMLFAKQRLEEIEADVLARTGHEASDEDTESLLESVDLGRAMMHNYGKRYTAPVPDHFEFAAAEQSIQVPVSGTEHQCPRCLELSGPQATVVYYVRPDGYIVSDKCDVCSGTGIAYHWLTGTLDGLLRHRNGDLYVLEHKTYSRRPDIMALQTNDQFTAYLWMLWQLDLGPVGGIAYDGMWKRKVVPKGKSFNDLFLRLPIRKSKGELEEFGFMLADELNEMARPDLPLYTNRRWEGCGDCGFERLCTAMSKRDDVDFVRQKYYTLRTDNKIRGIRSDEPDNPAQLDN